MNEPSRTAQEPIDSAATITPAKVDEAQIELLTNAVNVARAKLIEARDNYARALRDLNAAKFQRQKADGKRRLA